ASAILLNAWRHPEVSGLVLLNPWVRTEQGLARAHLRHYYLHRLFSAHLWGALLRGETRPGAALRGLVEVLIRGLGVSARAGENRPPDGPLAPHRPLPERLAEGWRRFDGARLLILSGADLTAAEFRDTARSHPAWQGLLDDPRLTLHELPEANHSFARRDWRDQVARWTGDWLLGLADAEGLP
ncbi:MAG: hydrolase 1, exosortase A system-associated, partial [Chromatiaceae bacterium]|nr:hydrolase 1, exosortase A system-associated [Chromatiaceae bacterium]